MAAAQTYEPIATQTLGSNTATVTFSSIPGTYTDLVLVASGTIASGTTDGVINFNSDTGNNYSRTYMYGNGTSALSGRNTSAGALLVFYWSTTVCNSIINIQNYANTTTYKTVVGRNNHTGNSTYAGVAMWQSTSAITRMDIAPTGGISWATGSVFTLYGIKAA
jgi:hypothetical protein